MRILVNYVAFHPDNHQGGSGKSFEFKLAVDIPDVLPACEIKDFITKEIGEMARNSTSFLADFKFSIQRMEIL